MLGSSPRAMSGSSGVLRTGRRRTTAIAVAALIASALGFAAPASAAVQVGLEVVEADHRAPLLGKKIGLVVTPGSVTADGRHSIDVLRKAGVDVVRLFAHERALRTRTAVWDRVAQNLDGTP